MGNQASLVDIVAYCNKRVSLDTVKDFSGALNGLQFQNNGIVTKIGAAVDAGKVPFEKAVQAGVDFLIVHHGMYWSPFPPVTGVQYEKVRTLLNGNCAVYGSHLPLDCHPEIGNNAILAKKLGLDVIETFLNYEGNDIGLIVNGITDREELEKRLGALFSNGFTMMAEGNSTLSRIGILTGSGSSALPYLKKFGVDTFITGELKQNFYNQAQEENLNLYCCGHYATEVYGVDALAKEVAEKFSLEYEFIYTDCPL
jgi:dinuclear metal center YbgI/SA1388 family protein